MPIGLTGSGITGLHADGSVTGKVCGRLSENWSLSAFAPWHGYWISGAPGDSEPPLTFRHMPLDTEISRYFEPTGTSVH
ncbi:hypothetical protein X883_3734 [Burkholderia pseudomallei MSHR4304]|nr:hypothetical protein X883_3734 [Burkholderia pseudomallei MSHR4304]